MAADRYAYLSFIGLFLVVAILIDRLLSKKLIRKASVRYGIAGIFILYGVFMMYATNKQSKYWIDSDILIGRAVSLSESAPAKALAHFYHGNIKQNIAENKYSQGKAASNEGMIRNSFIYYREAVSDYDSVIKYNPEYMLAYSNRGMIYGTMSYANPDYWEKANNDFDEAIRIKPDYADNYYNKAWLVFITGDTIAACELWKKADDLGSVVAKNALEQNCR